MEHGTPEQTETYPPLGGEPSVVLALRRHAAANGWTENDLRKRAEAARRKIRAIRASGGEVRNPAGFGLMLVKTMDPEEVEQFLSAPEPTAKDPWWKGKLEKSRREAEARARARESARADAEPIDPEIEERRQRIMRGAFDAASNVRARARVLGAPNAHIPGRVAERVHSKEAANDD